MPFTCRCTLHLHLLLLGPAYCRCCLCYLFTTRSLLSLPATLFSCTMPAAAPLTPSAPRYLLILFSLDAYSCRLHRFWNAVYCAPPLAPLLRTLLGGSHPLFLPATFRRSSASAVTHCRFYLPLRLLPPAACCLPRCWNSFLPGPAAGICDLISFG